MLLDMLYRHLVTLFTILLFSLKLWHQKNFRHTETRYFWVTVISCLILVVEDSLEVMTRQDPSLAFFRTLLSVIGYTCRSTAALGLLLVVIQNKRRSNLLWIPSLITFLVCCTAFFSDVAFGYNADYDFYRGPLGYVVFVVPIFYLLTIIWIVFKHFSERNGIEKYITPMCVVFCLSASLADIQAGGVRLTEAIIISSILFYIVLYSHDNRRDALTGLLNRQALYDDIVSFERSIVAAASVDMNGLKELNDSHGHSAGDEALIRIGKCLRAVTNRTTFAYRVGGDEFILLFLHGNEDRIGKVEEQVINSVAACGYSVAAGHAVREHGMDLDDVIKASDRRMYEHKANHYREREYDRRKAINNLSRRITDA